MIFRKMISTTLSEDLILRDFSKMVTRSFTDKEANLLPTNSNLLFHLLANNSSISLIQEPLFLLLSSHRTHKLTLSSRAQ